MVYQMRVMEMAHIGCYLSYLRIPTFCKWCIGTFEPPVDEDERQFWPGKCDFVRSMLSAIWGTYYMFSEILAVCPSWWHQFVSKFNLEGTFIYFTAGDQTKVKIFYLPNPPILSQSTTDPQLDKLYTKPFQLTFTGSVSSIYPLHLGRLLFSCSSLTSPNDVLLIQHLSQFLSEFTYPKSSSKGEKRQGNVQQVSWFTQAKLAEKRLSPGEEFYFVCANEKTIQGWALKPREWVGGQKKKYLVVLLIYGGPQGAWEDRWSTRWNPNGMQFIFSLVFGL